MLPKVMNMQKLNDYLTVKKTSKILGICEMTIRRWDSAGKLKSYRNPVNNYRLYKESDLRAFLKKITQNEKGI